MPGGTAMYGSQQPAFHNDACSRCLTVGCMEWSANLRTLVHSRHLFLVHVLCKLFVLLHKDEHHHCVATTASKVRHEALPHRCGTFVSDNIGHRLESAGIRQLAIWARLLVLHTSLSGVEGQGGKRINEASGHAGSQVAKNVVLEIASAEESSLDLGNRIQQCARRNAHRE